MISDKLKEIEERKLTAIEWRNEYNSYELINDFMRDEVDELVKALRCAVEALEHHAEGYIAHYKINEEVKPPGWRAIEALKEIETILEADEKR